MYVFIKYLLNLTLVQFMIVPLICKLFVKVFMTLLSIKPNPTQPQLEVSGKIKGKANAEFYHHGWERKVVGASRANPDQGAEGKARGNSQLKCG